MKKLFLFMSFLVVVVVARSQHNGYSNFDYENTALYPTSAYSFIRYDRKLVAEDLVQITPPKFILFTDDYIKIDNNIYVITNTFVSEDEKAAYYHTVYKYNKVIISVFPEDRPKIILSFGNKRYVVYFFD